MPNTNVVKNDASAKVSVMKNEQLPANPGELWMISREPYFEHGRQAGDFAPQTTKEALCDEYDDCGSFKTMHTEESVPADGTLFVTVRKEAYTKNAFIHNDTIKRPAYTIWRWQIMIDGELRSMLESQFAWCKLIKEADEQ